MTQNAGMIPYLSVDLETTGLEGPLDQIVEFGAVLETFDRPVDQLPVFHTYIDNGRLTGNAYALSMHPTILRRIATKEKGYSYLKPDEVGPALKEFLAATGFWVSPIQEGTKTVPVPKPKITPAGKNFGAFDLDFIRHQLPTLFDSVSFHYRILDTGNLYFDVRCDKCIPDTKVCIERAINICKNLGFVHKGLDATVAHTAVEDARQIIILNRVLWGLVHQADMLKLESGVLAF
jgi:hypothetical protein